MTSLFVHVDCSTDPPTTVNKRHYQTWRGWWWESADGENWKLLGPEMLAIVGGSSFQAPSGFPSAPPAVMTTEGMREYDLASDAMASLLRQKALA